MNWELKTSKGWQRLLVGLLLLGTPAMLVAEGDDVQATAPESQESAAAERIEKLIEQLGAEDFAARERAQAELAQLGLAAYDALNAAQIHHDPEIALRSRYLVRSMSVRWFADSDSPEVIRLLKDYGDLSESERKSRIDRLAASDN